VLEHDELGQRIERTPEEEAEPVPVPEIGADLENDAMRRFGQWDGVFARCLLNIFGVIMFVRLGYVFALGGIAYGGLVIIVSTVVTLITSLSLSAICTNGEVQGLDTS